MLSPYRSAADKARSIEVLSQFRIGQRVMVLWHAHQGEAARAEGPFAITDICDRGFVRIAGYPPSSWDSRTGSSRTGASTIYGWHA